VGSILIALAIASQWWNPQAARFGSIFGLALLFAGAWMHAKLEPDDSAG
jgi:hypothetical protein